MNSEIEHLDAVLRLVQAQRKEINAIRRSRTKRIGQREYPLSEEDKNLKIQNVQKRYSREIGNIYSSLNAGREADGHEPLRNPYA